MIPPRASGPAIGHDTGDLRVEMLWPGSVLLHFTIEGAAHAVRLGTMGANQLADALRHAAGLALDQRRQPVHAAAAELRALHMRAHAAPARVGAEALDLLDQLVGRLGDADSIELTAAQAMVLTRCQIGSTSGAEENCSVAYAGYDFNRNGRPVMGFHIAHKDGNLDGFMYHSINHPKFQIRDGQECLSFTYSGTAVVMTGTRMRLIFEALMRHTLKAIYEEDGRRPVSTDTPIVTRISIKQAVPMRGEGTAGLELVKGSRQE